MSGAQPAAATWIAFLRGVNVNGVRLTMSAVRATLSGIGLARVRTVLATGNVLFDDEDLDATGAAERKSAIENCLRDAFGYDAWIVLVSARELAPTMARFPFARDDPTIQPYVVLGSDPAVLRALTVETPQLDATMEATALGDNVLYWRVRAGHTTDSPFAKVLAKPRFRTTTTTRNLRTLDKVLVAAR